MNKILDNVKSPQDIKKLSFEELGILAGEIRETLINTVSENGGHLSSNLGVVELTLALHKCFKSPNDQIVWDVGHQAYTHKIITGRYDRFSTIRKEDGISGFTRPDESDHDVFYSGHSSTSVSSAFGLAMAKKIKNDKEHVIAVVGDGSFTGGMAYEGLNNAGRSRTKLIVVLNDNEMSISKNVGSFAKYLAVIRAKPEYEKIKSGTESTINKIPLIGKSISKGIYSVKKSIKNSIYSSNMFEDMGFRYVGPIDGHNIEHLCDALESAKMIDVPVLLHVKTVKGKGYDFAEQEPSTFHGISKFDINTGEPICGNADFSSVFGDYLCEIASKDRRICAITAAMLLGTGLKKFSEEFPDRFFDVGIAEEHAVTFASGLSANGMLPVFAVYSTFLQRCYDQLVHDGALQNSRMVLGIDRAGFVGEDGETHQGLFDVPFLNTIPDITVYSPSFFCELKSSFNKAFYHSDSLTAVRYPRGCENEIPDDFEITGNSYDVYGSKDSKIFIITYGRIFSYAAKAVKILKDKYNLDISVIKLNRIKPIDEEVFDLLSDADEAFFFEESMKSGGVAEKLASKILEKGFNLKYHITAVEDHFVKQASVKKQLEKYKLDTDGMVEEVSKHLV